MLTDIQECLDLSQVKAFTETLLGDLFKKDMKLTLQVAAKNYLLVPLRRLGPSLTYEIDFQKLRHCSLPLEKRIKDASSANLELRLCNLEKIGSLLFFTRANPHLISECTKVLDVKSVTVEQLLVDL